jgi:hypothetical protein
MRLIIDADPIVYRAGFASEQTTYELVAESPDGALLDLRFAPTLDEKDVRTTAGDHMKAWIAAHPEYVVLSKDRVAVPDPVSFALQAVKAELQAIYGHAETKFKQRPDMVTVLLSGPGNYREKLATLKPYKGNRDPEHKPFHYQAIRDYLTGEWGARVVSGHEADDEVSILSWEHWRADEPHGFVIATIDKDLDQIPGWHYNYMKHVWYFQEELDARRFFWQQCLAGDPTDNIGGVWKVAATGAEKLLNGWYDDTVSEADIWERIVATYSKSLLVPGCPYADKDPAEVALENARLVYMQQNPGELWNPPGAPMGELEARNVDD